MNIQSPNHLIKVSVIIPTYKRIDLLEKALNSLNYQTFREFEIILVDDNLDETFSQKISNFSKKYKNLKYIKNSSLHGSSSARNFGVINAKGDIIFFLDDDDEYPFDYIEKILNFYKKNDVDFSISNYRWIGKNTIHKRRKNDYLLKNLLEYHYFYHLTSNTTFTFTKSFFLKIGGYGNIDQGEDFYILEKAIINKGKIGFFEDSFVYLRKNISKENMSSFNNKIKRALDIFNYKKRKIYELKDIINKNHALLLVKVRFHMTNSQTYFHSFKIIFALFELLKAFLISPYFSFKLIFYYL